MSTLLNGHASLSCQMAMRLEQAFGVNMETLMRMQSAWDIAQTKQRGVSFQLERYRPDLIANGA